MFFISLWEQTSNQRCGPKQDGSLRIFPLTTTDGMIRSGCQRCFFLHAALEALALCVCSLRSHCIEFRWMEFHWISHSVNEEADWIWLTARSHPPHSHFQPLCLNICSAALWRFNSLGSHHLPSVWYHRTTLLWSEMTFRCCCCRSLWCGSVSRCLAHPWHTARICTKKLKFIYMLVLSKLTTCWCKLILTLLIFFNARLTSARSVYQCIAISLICS